MAEALFHLFARFFSLFSLRQLHQFGVVSGRLFFLIAGQQKRTLIQNLQYSGIFSSSAQQKIAVKKNIDEMGKGLIESLAIWAGSQAHVLSWIQQVNGQAYIDAAIASGNGIIFLTPHIGCFEIASIYYAHKNPMTILYRPARKKWMSELMLRGRRKGMISMAPTNTLGVRKLLQALHQGEAIGILPDQIASKGEGEWVSFFGRPMYTMTLVSRLALKTGASILVAVSERLEGGKGFTLHIYPVSAQEINTPAHLNAVMEKYIRLFPLQFMWSYDRHKKP